MKGRNKNIIIKKGEIMKEEFKVGDKVKNITRIGKIVEIKELHYGKNTHKVYLIEYSLFEFRNPFKRKKWTYGLSLEKVENE